MARRIDKIPAKVSFTVNARGRYRREGNSCTYGPYLGTRGASNMATRRKGEVRTFDLVPEGTAQKIRAALKRGDLFDIDDILDEIEALHEGSNGGH